MPQDGGAGLGGGGGKDGSGMGEVEGGVRLSGCVTWC